MVTLNTSSASPALLLSKRPFRKGCHFPLICAAEGNVLWDSVSFMDKKVLGKIRQLGGVHAIAISHPVSKAVSLWHQPSAVTLPATSWESVPVCQTDLQQLRLQLQHRPILRAATFFLLLCV